MTLDQILREERLIWDGVPVCGESANVTTIVVILGKILGDLCYQARQLLEGKGSSIPDMERELGNLISTTVRYIDDLGLDAEECVAAAFRAQRDYVTR